MAPGRQRGGRRWRRLVVGVAVVGVLTGCGGDDAGVDDGEVIETLLPTAPPATDPLDPSE